MVYTLSLLRVVIFLWMLSGCPCLFFVVFPASLWACAFSLLGELWSPGDIRDASPGFPFFDFHLDGKTDTVVCSDIIAHSSSRYSVWVLRRRSVRGKGPPRGCGSPAAVSLHGSIGLGHSGGSVTLDRRGGTNNTYFSGCQLSCLG